MCEEGAMRALILALTAVTILALTAFTAGAVLVGSAELGAPTDQKHQIRSGGLGVIGQSGFVRSGPFSTAGRSDRASTSSAFAAHPRTLRQQTQPSAVNIRRSLRRLPVRIFG